MANNNRLQNLLTQLQPQRQNIVSTLGNVAQGIGAGLQGQVLEPPKTGGGAQDLLAKLLIQKEVDRLNPTATEQLSQRKLAAMGEGISQPSVEAPTALPQAPQVEDFRTSGTARLSSGLDTISVPTGKTIFNEATGQFEPEVKTQIDPRIEAKIEVGKQVEAQKQKDILKSSQDFTNASLKIDGTVDSFVDTVDRTMQITGVRPGPGQFLLNPILGATGANEFMDGFSGGLVEYAASMGRIAMPGSRATRLIQLFKKGAPKQFNTIEAGVQNSADSFRSAVTTDMSRDPAAYFPKYNKLSKREQIEANRSLSRQAQLFEERFRMSTLAKVYIRNKNLLKVTTQKQIEARLLQDDETGRFAIQLSDGTTQEI